MKLLPTQYSKKIEAGTDEAGRGCLAGPVSAAAVIFSENYSNPDLNDSKKPVNVETLEKEIWQHSSDLETHTVETHIYRLRKKIKAEFGNDDLIKSDKDGYII